MTRHRAGELDGRCIACLEERGTRPICEEAAPADDADPVLRKWCGWCGHELEVPMADD